MIGAKDDHDHDGVLRGSLCAGRSSGPIGCDFATEPLKLLAPRPRALPGAAFVKQLPAT